MSAAVDQAGRGARNGISDISEIETYPVDRPILQCVRHSVSTFLMLLID